MEKYRFLEHTADIKFRAFGRTIEEAFKNSALALIKAMCKEKIRGKLKEKIIVKGKDKENLLYNFLEELLFLLDTKNLFLSSVKVKIKGLELTGEIKGDDAKNYPVSLDVKAVTYSQMFVKQTSGKFICQVVLDV